MFKKSPPKMPPAPLPAETPKAPSTIDERVSARVIQLLASKADAFTMHKRNMSLLLEEIETAMKTGAVPPALFGGGVGQADAFTTFVDEVIKARQVALSEIAREDQAAAEKAAADAARAAKEKEAKNLRYAKYIEWKLLQAEFADSESDDDSDAAPAPEP
jgi:hypothetical protein